MSDTVVRLSPVEHLFTGIGGYPITMTFSFAEPQPLEKLRAGLSQAVSHFPWVSSRLVSVDAVSWGLALEANNVGIERGEPIAPLETRDGQAVTRVVLSEDGRRLGVSISHAVVDGFSYFQFLAAWARLTRGERILAPSREPLPQTRYEGGLDAERVRQHCGIAWGATRAASAELREVRVRFANEALRAQREEAQTDGVRLFDNDLISARLWQEHGQAAGGVSELSVPIDLRALLRARRHFGCAVGCATLRLPAEQVATSSVIELGRQVRAAVAGYDKAAAALALGTLERLRHEHGRGVCEQLHVRHPEAGFIVTNLTRAPLRDIDFGAGAAEALSARAQIGHSAALYAVDGAVEAHVYLPADPASGG